MKSILISIQPQWVEKILNGEKTIEIRKTMPKCELPCKVYIYCTKGKPYLYRVNDDNKFELTNKLRFQDSSCFVKDYNAQNGKVVAEFTLNKIDIIEICDPDVLVNEKIVDVVEYKKQTCLSFDNFIDYIGYGDDHDGWGNKEWDIGYGWHIDGLKIYDKPKELSEFRKDLDCDDYPCNKGGKNSDCEYYYYDITEGCSACGIDFDGEHCIYKIIKRPPQSWCYVEEFNNGKH